MGLHFVSPVNKYPEHYIIRRIYADSIKICNI